MVREMYMTFHGTISDSDSDSCSVKCINTFHGPIVIVDSLVASS